MPDNDVQEIKLTISRIGKEVSDMMMEFNAHKKVDELNIKNIEHGLHSLSSDLKDMIAEMRTNRQHLDNVISTQHEHIEKKISDCHGKILATLNDTYITKEGAKILRDEALLEATADRNNQLNDLEDKLQKRIHYNAVKIIEIIFAPNHKQLDMFKEADDEK